MACGNHESTPTQAYTDTIPEAERDSYRRKVEVTIDSAGWASGGADSLAHLTGHVKNAGTLELGIVEVSVFFLDATGQRIQRWNVYPVNVGGGDRQANAVMKPGETRQFANTLRVPSAWGGKTETEVAAVHGPQTRAQRN